MTTVVARVYQKIRLRLRRKLLSSLQPCRDITALMSESLERRLNVLERAKLHLHMLVCAWCKLYLQQIILMRRVLVRAGPEMQTNTNLPIDARQRIVKRLEEKIDSP